MNKVTNKNQFIDKLHALIKNGDEVDRSYAIRALADLKDQSALGHLFECLHDPDLDVSIDAVNALGKIGGDGVADKLIESFLNDPEGEIKVACLEALSQLSDPKAIPHFLKVAENSPEDTQFDSGDWDLWWDMQLQAIRGLGALKSSEAIPILQRLIESDDYLDIENEIFNTLVDIGGQESDDYLLSLLTGNTARIKRRVAKALGRSQSKATLKLLARTLQDKDPDVREATLLALEARNVTQYLPAVLLLFRDSNANVRKTAVSVAQQLSQHIKQQDNSTDLIQSLTPLLRDTDPVVKTTVINALLSLGWQADKQASEMLSEQLSQCKGDCFTALCKVITKQQLSDGYANLLYLLRHNELGTEEKIHALNALGQSKQWNSAMESGIGALVFDDQSVVRLAALEALADLDNDFPHGVDYQERLPIEMISEALQGQLAPPATSKIIPIVPVEEIENKFSEGKQNTQGADEAKDKAANKTTVDTSFVDQALAEITQSIQKGEKPHPMSTLDSIAITHVEDELERAAATESAGGLNEQEQEDLTDFIALTEDNKEISRWLFNKESVDVGVDIMRLAARILGKVGSQSALPHLAQVFTSDDSELKREAALSIAQLLSNNHTNPIRDDKLNQQIHQALCETLNAEQRDLRIASARALAELGDVTDIPLLIEKLFDESVAMRIQTLHSLSKIACRIDDNATGDDAINFPALAELMLDQLNNNEQGIHRAAVEALIPLFGNKLNGSSAALKQTAISRLIQAGLSGSHGQVKDMSWGLKALDKELSGSRLLEKIDEVSSSVERRYMVEMLGELYRENASL